MSYYEISVKLLLTATRWEKDGDHPSVKPVPDNVVINGAPKEYLRALEKETGQFVVFDSRVPVWIVRYTTGANGIVSDEYFEQYYKIERELESLD